MLINTQKRKMTIVAASNGRYEKPRNVVCSREKSFVNLLFQQNLFLGLHQNAFVTENSRVVQHAKQLIQAQPLHENHKHRFFFFFFNKSNGDKMNVIECPLFYKNKADLLAV